MNDMFHLFVVVLIDIVMMKLTHIDITKKSFPFSTQKYVKGNDKYFFNIH